MLFAADVVTVAVASNFAKTAADISAAFTRDTGVAARISHGSTGKLYAQIINGAPFDIFFAADADDASARAEQDLANLLYLHLASCCDEVVVARNGPEGFRLARQGRWDLIILDLSMPKMSGLEVLAALRDHRVQPAVILMTAPILLPAFEMAGYTVRQDYTYQDAIGYSLAPTQAIVGFFTPGLSVSGLSPDGFAR